MSRPTLQRPSKDEAVKELQGLLNRVGALLVIDGDFGPATERAVKEAQELAHLPTTGIADEATWAWLEAQPAPSSDLSTQDVTFVVLQEVGSRGYYDRVTAFPHCPGEESGITIGIGYDLRFQGPGNFQADWGSEISSEALARLGSYLGLKGTQEAVSVLHSIQIPFQSAWRVFTKCGLPRYVSQTQSTYRQFSDLPDGCRGALVSLIYNRGTSLEGDSRREMRAIREYLAAGELGRVAGEIEAMKRLWPDGSGLRERRDREAALWRQGLEGAGAA
jgi:hypothetical protein